MNSIVVFVAQYLFIFVILLLGLSWLNIKDKNTRVKFIVAVIIAGIIAFIMSRIASKFFYDTRPFVAQHVKPLFPHAADNGFPSDHALLTGALTAVAYFFDKKYATGMLILTILIGIARVWAKVHSPLDIAGGWVFGIIGAYAGYYLAVWLIKKYGSKFKLAS